MQKFNETKQSGEAFPEKAAEPPESAEPVQGDTKEKEQLTVNPRQSPVGESHEGEHNTATPGVSDNSM